MDQFVLVHSVCDPNYYCYRQHSQRERSAPSPNKLWHHGEKCASVSYICLNNSRTFLSYHIGDLYGKILRPKFSYTSVRQVAAVTILLTLKMLDIKIKLISSVWILLHPVKHVSSVTFQYCLHLNKQKDRGKKKNSFSVFV